MIIYFKNLSPITSYEEIRSYFKTFGDIGELSINTFTLNNKTRCFGQVEMKYKKHGLAAFIDLKKKIFDGNKLTIRKE